MFINEYKWPNIVKNYRVFLNKIEELKLYIVKFDKNDIMKPKA